MTIAYIGMGANLASPAGPPAATLTAAALRLESLGRVRRRSSLYLTDPVGVREQPSFVNAAVELETELGPRELLNGLLGIELEFGRDRSAGVPNGPRTLDLDLLLFGECLIDEPGLEVPHPRLGERTFVLIPLCELNEQIFDARRKTTVSQLLHKLDGTVEVGNCGAVQIQFDGWRAGGIDLRSCGGVVTNAGRDDCDGGG